MLRTAAGDEPRPSGGVGDEAEHSRGPRTCAAARCWVAKPLQRLNLIGERRVHGCFVPRVPRNAVHWFAEPLQHVDVAVIGSICTRSFKPIISPVHALRDRKVPAAHYILSNKTIVRPVVS